MEYLQDRRSEICHILEPSHFSLHYRPICGTPALRSPLRSGKLNFLNGEPALRIDEPALGSGKSALRIGHPLHDDEAPS